MKLLPMITTITATTFVLLLSANAKATPLDKYVEQSLIAVCKSTMKGNLFKFHKTLKFYRLQQKTIANGLVCNGSNVTEFARKHGAYKIANRLETHLDNNTSIVDIAAVNKMGVTFEE
ncbi:DUF3718 domain-containing protein [Thalassotalea sediminis]|uniref:DUF3718 domain-containing protein n=1 Tax=Thalassotalea sediminis TaxID=1759089 RepID=UPI00257257C2|nr:DUF3718 domain-containing protein [Thalassotalea sediminis]